MEKIAWNGRKWGREVFFPANPDLADVLGDTNSDFENLDLLDFLDPRFLDFQIPEFPDSRVSSSYIWPAWFRG